MNTSISILGSTGSIGRNALDVVAHNSSRFKVAGLAAYRNIALLAEQIERFKPQVAAVFERQDAERLSDMLGRSTQTKIVSGADGYREVASLKAVSRVLSAMVGAAGLLPTLEAVEAGKDVALANKETLVMAGDIVMERARSKGVAILPVDSEHSAIFQCLEGRDRESVYRIILTASGGPFFNRSAESLRSVTVDEALKHPNWRMGAKITVDSATMMNKGLEIIEAMRLFAMDIDRIGVVVHPQSIVHSMVEFVDGSIIAQLGVPDMRVPICYALAYPERISSENHRLNLCEAGTLDFFPPDEEKFPCMKLACDAARKGGTAPAVLNAANEIAVNAFIANSIGFADIAGIIDAVLSRHEVQTTRTVEEIIAADEWARSEAGKIIERIRINNC